MGRADDSDLRQWVCTEQLIKNHAEMGDLVGVRIGLYHPDDCQKVAKEIEK